MTEKQATSAANKLLRQMKTSGWEIRVWENLGWHYSLLLQVGDDCGVSLSDCSHQGKITYYCLASRNYLGSGETQWTSNKYFDDPNSAFEHQLARIKKEAKSIVKFVNQIKLAANL